MRECSTERNVPVRGPSGATLFLVGAAAIVLGMYVPVCRPHISDVFNYMFDPRQTKTKLEIEHLT